MSDLKAFHKAGKQISSAQNSIFKDLLELLGSKGIRKQKRFLIFGEKFVRETFAHHPSLCLEVLVAPKAPSDLQLPQVELGGDLFREIDIFGTHQPILVCKTPDMGTWSAAEPARGFKLLIALSEPSNLGAVIRSSCAFGVSEMILLKESASPLHPKAVRASAGAVLQMSYSHGPSIRDLGDLENAFALDMQGLALPSFSWPQDGYLLLGEEGRGVPSEIKLPRLKIPFDSGVESLNAAVAASIALYSRYQAKL